MPSSPRSSRPRALWAGLAGSLILAGCSSGGHRSAAPTTTLIATDNWRAPTVSGPPSPSAFCTVLVAMYRHVADLPLATPKVKVEFLRDFVATVPEAVSAAPPPVATAARSYLTSLTGVLNGLIGAGLDYHKLRPGTLTPILLDPSIKAAGNQVLGYAQSVCHYTIGGAPTGP